MWLAGFDPGGESQFGWCVVEASAERPLSLHRTGAASNAAEAVSCVLKEVPPESTLIAAGIDSPLFWLPDGDRNADRVIRHEIQKLGASAPAGTVQHVNSLRGACVVQGVLAAMLLRAAIPSINITEAHPKALLWLIGVATERQPVKSVTMRELSEFFLFRSGVRDSKNNGYADSDICAFSALAAGADGLIQTVAVFTKAESYLDHVIVGPGQVLRQAHGRSDGLGLWQNPVERCDLRSADFFAGCVESFDADCLDPEMWVENCAALGDLTCPEA